MKLRVNSIMPWIADSLNKKEDYFYKSILQTIVTYFIFQKKLEYPEKINICCKSLANFITLLSVTNKLYHTAVYH
jgi:uncharacterized membrane protein